MGTMTAENPFAAADEAFRKRFRLQDAAQQWRDLNDRSPAELKRLLGKVVAAEKVLAGIEQSLADLRAKREAAVEKHGTITAPLQAALADPGTTAARRIEARSLVIAANAQLETEIKALDSLIEAAQFEYELARADASGRVVVENAFVAAGSEDEQDRVRILRKAEELLANFALDPARRRAEDAENAAKSAKEKLAGDRPSRWQESEAVEAERLAKYWSGVRNVLAGFLRSAQNERYAIRERRLAELYKS